VGLATRQAVGIRPGSFLSAGGLARLANPPIRLRCAGAPPTLCLKHSSQFQQSDGAEGSFIFAHVARQPI
jgi:hypothetical protein